MDCERLLVTLLRGLGPWKDSVCLVGGLTPRYLVPARPPVVPAHAGTQDVDVVVDLQLLTETAAYRTLEQNLYRMGFERGENDTGQKVSWRWQARTEHGAVMMLELLADAPERRGGMVGPLPTEGTISAINIPHASMVFDLYQEVAITAELLGENGVATVKVKHANLVSFTCLKALAVAAAFRKELDGKHGAVVSASLAILRSHFGSDMNNEGFKKDGPVAVARFEIGEGNEPGTREARALRQRQASDLAERLLALVG
jgi:hypothetical protein